MGISLIQDLIEAYPAAVLLEQMLDVLMRQLFLRAFF